MSRADARFFKRFIVIEALALFVAFGGVAVSRRFPGEQVLFWANVASFVCLFELRRRELFAPQDD